jgi:glutathione S-transferase
MIDEVALRRALGRWSGRFTLPIWIDGATILEDSDTIARFADAHRRGPTWFPAEHTDAIHTWNQLSTSMLQSGRVLTTRAVASDRRALRASVPAPFRALPPLADALGTAGVRYLSRKYRFTDPTVDAEHQRVLEQGLAHLATAVGAGPWLVGERLTWADVSMAFALDFVFPRADHPLEDAARPCWQRPELARQYPHLLKWRDAVLDSDG